ncbi:MAG TPA: DUF998 domain-containing protein [Planctomycetota bacterium]|nr:DUF998 domain-containing protein [Planctomycetota bacterium]
MSTRPTAARVAFGSGLVAFVLLAVLHLLRPDLQPSGHVISEYAVGAHGWVMALSFFSLAVGCAGVTVVLVSRIKTIAGRIGLVFMLAATIGLGMATMFPMDPITVSPENSSFSGKMHGVAAMVGNPGFMIGALLLSLALRRDPDWADVRPLLLAMTAVIWISFVLMMVLMIRMMQQQGDSPTGGIGWANRLLWVAYCAWLMLAAWPVARAPSTRHA